MISPNKPNKPINNNIEKYKDNSSNLLKDLKSIKNLVKDDYKLETVKHTSRSMARVNPDILEAWIHEFLKEADQVKVAGSKMNKYMLGGDSLMMKYGIDRNYLALQEVPDQIIDRIYKNLFLYSVGFYDVLIETLKDIPNRNNIITNVWIVFNTLVQVCCKSEYESAISQITSKYFQQFEDASEDMRKDNERLTETVKQVSTKYSDAKAEVDAVHVELDKLNKRYENLKHDYDKSLDMHEREVAMRLEYEHKLNSTKGIYRELEMKFKTLASEFAFTINTVNQLYAELSNYKKQCTDLIQDNQQLKRYYDENQETKQNYINQVNQKAEIIKGQHEEVKKATSQLLIAKNRLDKVENNYHNLERQYKMKFTEIESLKKYKKESDKNFHYFEEMLKYKDIKINELEAENVKYREDYYAAMNNCDLKVIELQTNQQEIKYLKERNRMLIEENKEIKSNFHTATIQKDTLAIKFAQIQTEFMNTALKLSVSNTNQKQLTDYNKALSDKLNSLIENTKKSETLVDELNRELIVTKEEKTIMAFELSNKESRINQLESYGEITDKSYKANTEYLNTILNEQYAVTRDVRSQLYDQKIAYRNMVQQFTAQESDLRTLKAMSSKYRIELENLKTRHTMLEDTYTRVNRELVELKIQNSVDKNTNEYYTEKFKHWERERKEYIAKIENAFYKKSEVLNQELSIMTMMYEDSLTQLYRKDDLINEMQESADNDKFKIREMNIHAQKLQDEYKDSFNKITMQADKINLLNSSIKDTENQKKELENKIKVNRNKEDYMKNEIKKHHKNSEQNLAQIKELQDKIVNLNQSAQLLNKFLEISKKARTCEFTYNASNTHKVIQYEFDFSEEVAAKEIGNNNNNKQTRAKNEDNTNNNNSSDNQQQQQQQQIQSRMMGGLVGSKKDKMNELYAAFKELDSRMRKQQAEVENLLKNLKEDQPCPYCMRKAQSESDFDRMTTHQHHLHSTKNNNYLSQSVNLSYNDIKADHPMDEIEEDIETQDGGGTFTIEEMNVYNRNLARESLHSIHKKNKVKIGNLMKISLNRYSTPRRN